MIQTKELPTKIPQGYLTVFEDIRIQIKNAQSRALSSVNRELIEVYRGIGKTISEQQEHEKWGDSAVKTLASDLQKAFPGMRGFSSRNLYIMRDLHLSYKDDQKLQTLSAQISWSHNVALLTKCKDSIQRDKD